MVDPDLVEQAAAPGATGGRSLQQSSPAGAAGAVVRSPLPRRRRKHPDGALPAALTISRRILSRRRPRRALAAGWSATTRSLTWRLVWTALGALIGVQFPLFWSGLLGAAVAAALADLAAGERPTPPRGLRLIVQIALGCLLGTSLVPALAYPTLLPAALGPVIATAALWGLGAALIARLGRVDLTVALTSPTLGAASVTRWGHLVSGLQLARGLGVLLVTAWLTQ
jgi:hypothetical protein